MADVVMKHRTKEQGPIGTALTRMRLETTRL